MKWIKCSERLPEFHEDVFVMSKYGQIDYMFLQISDFNNLSSKKYWRHNIDQCIDCSELDPLDLDYVMYWLPVTILPETSEEDKKQFIRNRIQNFKCPDGKMGCLVAHSSKSVQEALNKIGDPK